MEDDSLASDLAAAFDEAKPEAEDIKEEITEAVKDEPVKVEPEDAVEVKSEEVKEEIKEEVKSGPPEWQKLGMKKEDSEAWEKADPKLKEIIQRRNDEMHKGIEQNREAAGFGQAIQRAIAPYEATLRSEGVNAEQAVQSLFNTEHVLRHGSPQEKTNMLMTLAKSYGIDLGNIEEPQYVDPQIQHLQDEIRQMRQQQQSVMQTQQQNEQAEMTSTLTQFAEGKEFFEQVRPQMSALLQAGQAKDLQEAYDMAVWARPDTRQAILAKQQAETETKRQGDAVAKAAAAKRAGFDVQGQGGMGMPSKTGSLRDVLAAALGDY